MHHLVVESWSRGASPLHLRDSRVKLISLIALLIAISTTDPSAYLAFLAYGCLLMAGAAAARLPIPTLLARAALVLPFSATFALFTWWVGDGERAIGLVEKSFLSGAAALLFVSTTPFIAWTAALDSWKVPPTLILIVQFLYRYLFVIVDQAQRMRYAALCRGGRRKARRSAFQAAAGAVGMLFVHSWERAEGIYRAMLARGFRGRFTLATPPPLRMTDFAFLCGSLAVSLAIRFGL